jgi:hydroxyacid-oxoacid transhydrogenase
VNRLLRLAQQSHCPCHSCAAGHTAHDVAKLANVLRTGGQARHYATPVDTPATQGDYAFEVAASNLRFGEGVTREVGFDFANLGAKKVGVYTDETCVVVPSYLFSGAHSCDG